MKRILIAGAGSYIGRSVRTYLQQWPQNYQVDMVRMSDGSWKEKSFCGYDVVLHLAGIVHQEKSKCDESQAGLYEQVNTKLALETAQKAKTDGVGQFIFMSSASVYGLTAPFGKTVMITKDTPLKPIDNYGISKAKAEEWLQQLADDNFHLAIIRPPIVYGKSCKGNFAILEKLAKRLPVFPKVDNLRSMIYVDNLSELIRLIIDDGAQGIFCPQNNEYSNTSDVVSQIAHANGKGILLIGGFGWALKLLRHVTPKVDKAFGSLCYDFEISRYSRDYCVKSLNESIQEIERR